MEAKKYATADEITAGDLDLDGEDLTLPSGRLVRVRGLSRFELMANAKGTDDSGLVERRNIAACLVAPRLTVAQVEAWQKRSAAGTEFKVLSEKIRELSAVGEGADKSDPGADGEPG
jgi:hypothetical protein